MLHPDAPEKRKAWRKFIDVQTRFQTRADVFQAIGQGVSQFNFGRRTRFVHVVTRNGNGIEFGHKPGAIRKNIADDAHAWSGWIYIGVAHHEFLQNIILDGARKLFRFETLLFGGYDKKRHDGNHRAIHRHGNRHLIERNLIEQHLHVFHSINGYPGFPHIAKYPRMVRIVAAVGGQVESDRQAFLSGRQIAPIKCVAGLCGGETCILADGPGLGNEHAAVRAAQIRRNPCHITQAGNPWFCVGQPQR